MALVTHVVERFYAAHCVCCAEALSVVQQFASERHDVDVVPLDIAHHLARARRYGLFATPAIVIDRMDALYGVPTRVEFGARLGSSAGMDDSTSINQ